MYDEQDRELAEELARQAAIAIARARRHAADRVLGSLPSPPDPPERDPHDERMLGIGRLTAGLAHDFNNLLSVAQRVRSIHPRIAVLYMTGHADDAIARRGLFEPGAALLRKPIHAELLQQRVRELLGG